MENPEKLTFGTQDEDQQSKEKKDLIYYIRIYIKCLSDAYLCVSFTQAFK